MAETYSKPCQLSNMMRHTKNPGVVHIVYLLTFSDIFRNIQQYSVVLVHT